MRSSWQIRGDRHEACPKTKQLVGLTGTNWDAVAEALKMLHQDGDAEVKGRYVHIVDLETLERSPRTSRMSLTLSALVVWLHTLEGRADLYAMPGLTPL